MNKVKCPSGEFEAIYKDESYKFLGIPYATTKIDGMNQDF